MPTHVLAYGRSLCGLPGVPGDWPPGHVWVAFIDREHLGEADCPGCLEVLAQATEERGEDPGGEPVVFHPDELAEHLGLPPGSVTLDIAQDGRVAAVDIRIHGREPTAEEESRATSFFARLPGVTSARRAPKV